MGGVTIGHTIYFSQTRDEIKAYPPLFKHEALHVVQYEAAGGVIPFLLTYFFQWIGNGFKYMEIPYEKFAYGQMYYPFTEDEQREWNRWFS